jgi:aminoglycoside phosphotransferase (APT) family kinase protein
VSEELKAQIAAYLRVRMPEAGAIEINALSRIHGGASRETFRVRVNMEHGGERGLIFRRDPVSTLIETDREVEFSAYRSFHNSDVPVPGALFLETETQWLERPFFVMEEVEGGAAASILAGDPYGAHAEAIGAQFFSILGRIAARDAASSELAKHAAKPAPDKAWMRELVHWEKVIDEDELEPQPIARAAIRWMRRNPPPPAQRISIVHGDYRTGNFLHDGQGRIIAILDWEMAHLGDPLEDLAWALDPLWAHHNPARPAGTISREAGIAAWEKASGLKADAKALEWWSMFASVKGLAIWISSAKEFQSGTNTDPVMAFSGLYCLPYHNKVLADRLVALNTGAQP